MTLSEISIRRPVFAWMLMFGLIVFGAIGFLRMGISQLPDVDFPVISVNLSLVGAAPEVMETEIVDVIEDAVMGIQGVRTVTSTSQNGNATVTIEFELDRNIDVAFQDVQAKVSQAQRNLPREMDPPVITRVNPSDQPIIWLALTSDKQSLRDLMIYVNDQLKNQFTTLPGVGDIQLGGYLDPNLRVWVDAGRLQRYQLTVTDLMNTIQQEHYEPPSGTLQNGPKEYNVRTLGEASTVQEFGRLPLLRRGGSPNFVPIPLEQVSKVEFGLADIRKLSRANGVAAVGLGIQKQRGSNAVAVAQAVKARMVSIQQSLPPGMKLAVNFDSTKFIEQSVSELNFTLLLAALLTAFVCWIFLGSWSATLNVLLAIPTSIIGTFIVLYFSGFTLNTFTLLALSLSVGIVVDDAIMVLENIVRHRENGEGRVAAALFGAREITFAAVATSVSILAIFLPVVFMKGIIGRFFFQLGVTMAVAVLLSLLEALTLAPMRCAAFLKVGERRTRFGRGVDAGFKWVAELYRRALDVVLRHRLIVLVTALAIFGLSLFSIGRINKEFLPAQDMGIFIIRVQTPVGSSIDYTDDRMKRIERFLGSRQEVERYYISIGGFQGGAVNTAFSFVTLKDRGKRGKDPQAGHELSQQELMAICRKSFNQIPGVKAVVQDLSSRGFSTSQGFPVEMTIEGSDWGELGRLSSRITGELQKSGLVSDLDTDYKPGMPELRVFPDRERAAARAVSIHDVGDTINAMIGGALVGRYPVGGHRYDIRVKLQGDNRERLSVINNLYVRNNRGELVRLSDVVRIETAPTLPTIARRDRQRAISIFANVAPGKSQQAALQEAQRIARKVLPPSYRLIMSGSSQTFQESFSSLIVALVLGILVAYMVLASQFNSFTDPFTVLMALPFSVTGALFGLLVTGQSLNIYSMIGLILLMGIVKKNSILLVDFTNRVRDEEGIPIREALLRACPMRLRPILMTSIAIIAGALPAALALGPGAETRIPMSVAVIGGVLVSTFLTLFVVPCVYTLLTQRSRRTSYVRELKEALRSGPKVKPSQPPAPERKAG